WMWEHLIDLYMKGVHHFAALLLVTCMPLALRAKQQTDAPSAFEQCRTVTAEDLADKNAPNFGSYSAAIPATSRPDRLDLESNPVARTYRTVLRTQAAQGPNFAGHYRVAAWGCGSSCTMFAVVDLDTGKVITPRAFTHTSGVFFGDDIQQVVPGSQSQFWMLAFRKNSTLLVVFGDLDENEKREGAFYFVLDHGSLRLIHSTRVKKDCQHLQRQP
ncbi:MAG: hypothetical protein KGL75_02425, partial [Acidobacteriota bacterium]|nr:hypothetical protein [Acidobacteriota bacterium]